MDNFDLKKYLAEGRLLKENIDLPELEDEFEGAMDAMVVEPEVYLQDIIDASADEIVSDSYYEIMNAVEQGIYSKDEAVKLAKSWAKEKLSTLAEGKLLKEDQASDLINDGVVLYISDDSKLAPGFVEPKKIGFIVYNKAVKDTSKSILSITGNLSKNKKVIDIFSDNYPNTDPNYISTFFTDPKNWFAINSEDELNSFMSKYSKVYLINHNGDSSKLKESLSEAFNPFLDTEEGGYMREYIDDTAEEEGLDLDYRNEFDEAFDLALTKLRKDHPELDFNLIVQNKESFF